MTDLRFIRKLNVPDSELLRIGAIQEAYQKYLRKHAILMNEATPAGAAYRNGFKGFAWNRTLADFPFWAAGRENKRLGLPADPPKPEPQPAFRMDDEPSIVEQIDEIIGQSSAWDVMLALKQAFEERASRIQEFEPAAATTYRMLVRRMREAAEVAKEGGLVDNNRPEDSSYYL